MWVDASAKMPTWQRRHSLRACLSRPSGRGQRGGAAGTPWRLRRSCHLAQLASQQCTQMPQNGAERPDPPICVHYCDPKATHNPSPRPNSVHKCPKTATRGHFGRSVYTPASPHGRSNDPREVQQCTQMPQNGAERPFPPICVHCCVAAGAVTQPPTHTNYRRAKIHRR